MCPSLFFNKVAGPGLGLQLYYKREPDPGVFQNFTKFLRTPFS